MGRPGGNWLIAKVAGESFAFPVDAVREIVETPPSIPVPLAPEFLIGIANVKGEILPLLDTGALLLDRAAGPGPATVVVTRGETVCGLTVHDVTGLKPLDAAAAEARFQGSVRDRFFHGTLPLDGTIVSLVDFEGLFPFLEEAFQPGIAKGVQV